MTLNEKNLSIALLKEKLESLTNKKIVLISENSENNVVFDIFDKAGCKYFLYLESASSYGALDIQRFDGVNVGNITLNIYHDYVTIGEVEIKEEYRNKGIYTAALHVLAVHFVNKGYKGIKSLWNNRNKESSRVWAKISNAKQDENNTYYLSEENSNTNYKRPTIRDHLKKNLKKQNQFT